MTLELPDLQQASLDWSTVERLLADIQACAVLLSVVSRGAGKTMTAETRALEPTHLAAALTDAGMQLRDRTIQGLQIRYSFENITWRDTLMTTPTGYRLVRTQE